MAFRFATPCHFDGRDYATGDKVPAKMLKLKRAESLKDQSILVDDEPPPEPEPASDSTGDDSDSKGD